MCQSDLCLAESAPAEIAPKAFAPDFLRKLACTLGFMSAFGPFAIDMYLPAFPRIAVELGTSPGMVQLTLAVFLLGLACGQFFWGTLSDHVGRRGPTLAGLLLFCATSAICASTHSIHTLIAARFFMGVGGSAGIVISRAIVRDLFEKEEASKFYSMMMIIGGIGPIVAPFLGSLLLIHSSWRAIFWTVTVLGVFCIAAFLSNVPETLSKEKRTRGHIAEVLRGYLRMLMNRRFLSPSLTIGFTSGMLFTYISNASFLFIELFGIPVAFFGFLFATNAIGIYLGGQSNRWLLRKFSSGQLLHTAMKINLTMALLLVACAKTGFGGFPLFFAILFLCLSTLGVIFPNAVALTMQPFAAEAGSASALLGVVQFVLGSSAGALAGVFRNGTSLPVAVQIACFGLLAQAILLFTSEKRKNEI